MDYLLDDAKKRKFEQDLNGSSALLSKEELKHLLEPFSREQLVSLLVDAGSLYPAVADEIRDVASKDPAHRKLFVRGLAWETTSQALRDAFAQYGEIEEGAVIVDKATGKSRGFGFITFKHMDSAQRALKEPSKSIDGRITVCNLASTGTISTTSAPDQAQRKLYIGGLSFETTSETLLNIFSQYGEIEEGSVAYDKNTNKSRGFAFVTFKTGESAKRAIEDPNKTIEGRHVIVKFAAEGQKDKGSGQMGMPQGQSMPQVQPGYGAANANMANYPRQQVVAQAGPGMGLSAYSPGLAAYTNQPAYAGFTATSQYGAVIPSASQQYAQYAAVFPGQPGQAALGAGGPSGVPPYYTGAS